MKKYRKWQNIFAATLLICFLLMVVSIILIFSLSKLAPDMTVFLAVAAAFFWGVVIIFFSGKFQYYAMKTQIHGLNEHYLGPVINKYDKLDYHLFSLLHKKGFQKIKQYQNIDITNRLSYDLDLPYAKRGVLEIVMLIKDDTIGFYDETTDNIIGKIENVYQKDKIKYSNYFIFPIKTVFEITPENLKLVADITLDKTNKYAITVIPVYYEEKTNHFYFLNSSYLPTDQYKYAKNFIIENFSK